MQSEINHQQGTFSTSNSPIFRIATRADIDAVVDLTNSTLQSAKLVRGNRTSTSHVANLIESPEGAIFVAEADNQIVASIHIEKPDKMYAVTVHKDWQNKDIGIHLLRTAAAYAKHTLGMTKLQGPILTSRTDLFEFYERLGCVRTGILVDHPDGGGLKGEMIMRIL
ncbi:hypothetical protein AC1031_018980 [Aphanomyces cochlioides]|nr:hypothetical protein AC1031_018980 [Aphanomyces cochlioides]